MGAKILVCGATGNIGREVVRRLAERGADVTAGTTSEDKAAKFVEQGVKAEVLNYGDPASLKRAMDGKERVFLVQPFREEMRHWGMAAVGAAKTAGVGFIVCSSGLLADTEAHYRLGKIHGAIDAEVQKTGIPCAILRPNTFMQNYVHHYGQSIREQGFFALPEADARRSSIDVRDIAAAAAEILFRPEGHEDKVYLLTGPEALSNFDVAAILSETLGRAVAYRPLSEEQARETWLAAGMPEWNVDMLLGLERQVREGVTALVTGAVRHLTGRDPIPFRQFAKDYRKSWM